MLSIVILAAGMASRFGAVKQLTPVGPRGETILEYNVHDALRAGFERVVLVTRPELHSAMQALAERSFGPRADTRIALQSVPEGRHKPLGSAAAVATAAAHVDGFFAVANADDVYGPAAFVALASAAEQEGNAACVVAYRLSDTVPARGAVTRALLQVDGDRLSDLEETPGIRRHGQGGFAIDGTSRRLDGHEMVSMNLWGLPGQTMGLIRSAVEAFRPLSGSSEEIFLPEVLRRLHRQGALTLTWVASGEPWTGITNPEDLDTVRSFLGARGQAGLWSA